MALSHISIPVAFGASATRTGSHPSTVLAITVAELGDGTNINNALTLSPEGIVLGLLQWLNENQGTSATRALEVTRNTPVLTTRGGDTVQGERYTLTIYSSVPVEPIDPDDV